MMDWFSSSRPLIIGHRGASHDAPENTLAAFGLAVEQGANGIELDVRLSADGWPVIIHDATVDRTSNGRGRVDSLTVAQLQQLDLGHSQTVPTLDDLFEMLGRQTLYNIELKGTGLANSGLEAAVADRIQAYGLESHSLVSSFNVLAMKRMRQHVPTRVGLGLIRDRSFARVGHQLAAVQADHPHFSLVDRTMMAWAKQHTLRVHVWTVDEPQEARRLAQLAVNGIITNVPAVIGNALSGGNATTP